MLDVTRTPRRLSNAVVIVEARTRKKMALNARKRRSGWTWRARRPSKKSSVSRHGRVKSSFTVVRSRPSRFSSSSTTYLPACRRLKSASTGRFWLQ
jgi:hypothetical protein